MRQEPTTQREAQLAISIREGQAKTDELWAEKFPAAAEHYREMARAGREEAERIRTLLPSLPNPCERRHKRYRCNLERGHDGKHREMNGQQLLAEW